MQRFACFARAIQFTHVQALAATARVVIHVDVGVNKPDDSLLIEIIELVDACPGG